ncbi:hypothetical protein SODALDRAFT_134324 [Sodiomyces alkalinus F11]|uniref:Heterokaryon incompatibility domain-containing protein n=1 Tax=Sodiomyces alkalinus (strain CBS 110278 / VKM F-3762 / F11) TaxID=1314773 RepID=A0A3N2PYP6_SODAK|nr:hypothetical protein SODALDRAFT_134324 [Sodiomyces alkalinus F11]ROT39614.1 hypothetical protein SODALDRAFT_134324 [Sodiomyces alkalinus F11]
MRSGPRGCLSPRVREMNSIYQGSYFTLVAGSGDNANSDLPGVRLHPRAPRQLVARINPDLKMAAVHGIDWHLRRSAYRERGWTLQELVLPRRTIIFINNPVYFSCPATRPTSSASSGRKTLIRWNSYDQNDDVNDLDCHEEYEEPRRIALWGGRICRVPAAVGRSPAP